jgi:hypothetical protein
MQGLHRGDHTQFGKSRYIFRSEYLGVFERKPDIPAVFAGLLQSCFECIERFPVRRIADGMDPHVEADVQQFYRVLRRLVLG